MNYIKIQQDILKSLDKQRTERDWWFIDSDRDGRVWLSYKGYMLLSVPKELWYLDTDRILKWQNKEPLHEDIVTNALAKVSEAEGATFRGTVVFCEKQTARVYKKMNDEEWRGDARLFKYCDKFNTFAFIARNSLLYIFDNGKVIGGILPFTWWLMKEGK